MRLKHKRLLYDNLNVLKFRRRKGGGNVRNKKKRKGKISTVSLASKMDNFSNCQNDSSKS